jgi:hypothetical protein
MQTVLQRIPASAVSAPIGVVTTKSTPANIDTNELEQLLLKRDATTLGPKRDAINATISVVKQKLKEQGADITDTTTAPTSAVIPIEDKVKTAGSTTTAEKTAAAEVTKSYDKNPEYATLLKLTDDLDRMGILADTLRTDPNLKNAIGPWDSRMPTLFAKTGDIEARIENLKTLTGFNTLASMRGASKTGGALGAISDKENEMLQNAIAALASLNQSEKGYKEQLQKVKDFVAASKQRYIDAFKAQYPDADLSALYKKTSTAPVTNGKPRSNKDLFDTYLKD